MSEQPRRRAPRAIAVAAVAIALAAGSLAATRVTDEGDEPLTMTVSFTRAGLNIRTGDEVRVRGLPVGTITAIEVPPDASEAVYTLTIDPGVAIAADSGARVVPKTLFGDKYIELEAAPAGSPVLAAGDHIPMDRTAHVAELEEVLDELGTLLAHVDATTLGQTLSSFAEGLGDGSSLRRAVRGFADGGEAVVARQADIRTLLATLPPVADSVADGADDLTRGLSDLASVLEVLEDEEGTLTDALTSNAELLRRANALFSDDRFDRIVSGGLDVLAIVERHPGAVEEYLRGVPGYLEGLVSATFADTLYANVPHVLVGLPSFDTHGGDHEGGRGPGPHIVICYDEVEGTGAHGSDECGESAR